MTDLSENIDPEVVKMLRSPRVQARLRGEPHRHHSECIHNLPPEDQVELRGHTVEWWKAYVGELPRQIGPGDWHD